MHGTPILVVVSNLFQPKQKRSVSGPSEID